jgi:site-specific DNA-methyltransferase (adenine-specific)/modification methylase
MRKEVINNCTLYLGDCKEIIDELKFDTIITDPPYGINYKATQPNATKFEHIKNDQEEFDPSFLFSFCDNVLLWGANNFCTKLPKGGWIVWDKRITEQADKMMGSPFELAWISDARKYKIARIQHGGVKNADYTSGQGLKNDIRFHPTQKPIRLMSFCIDLFPKSKIILDPYMGSGSTALACINKNKQFIGIEIEEEYFDIACERISAANYEPWKHTKKKTLFEDI